MSVNAPALDFKTLPWEIPKSVQNFVPECSRFFTHDECGVFFAWRCDTSLLFSFRLKPRDLLFQKPLQSQVILSKEPILDIVLVDNCIFFVSSRGLFQVLCSKEKAHCGEVLNHLEDCRTFFLSDAFELSPLKRILAVTSMHDRICSSNQNTFAVVTCTQDNSKVEAEIYFVSQDGTARPTCQIQFISFICSVNNPLNIRNCTCSFLSWNQVRTIFNEFKDADILLVGLNLGQLFCIPFFISSRKYGIKPVARLLYQSPWPINGLTCPPDGFSIFLFLQGGTVVNISPLSDLSSKSSHTSLSYNSFSLSCPMRCFSAPLCNLLVISDSINTSVIRVTSTNQIDANTIALKGVTAMSPIPETNFVIASTSHNIFYLLDPSHSIRIESSSNLPWAVCNLDVCLQFVQEMKAQTALLSKLRKELEEENSLIKALSVVARAPVMADSFRISVKVVDTHQEKTMKCTDKLLGFNNMHDETQDKPGISVEIRNNSPEDFSPLLWKMCLEIKSFDGLAITTNVLLPRTFNNECPFCTTLHVPFLAEDFTLPIQVKAFLIAEINDAKGENQWLKIYLGMGSLDISHFFHVTTQAPQAPVKNLSDFSVLINQMQSLCSDAHPQNKELEENASMMSCIIPVPEKFRQPKMIIDKILMNCCQRQSLAVEENFHNQSDKTVIWLKFIQKNIKLVFRRSCTSITISSSDLIFLHSVKLYLASVFGVNLKSSLAHTKQDASYDDVYCKAKNLSAVLETLSLSEVLDRRQLIAIYQDLRNNVSSHIS